jgi:hypothetical protein
VNANNTIIDSCFYHGSAEVHEQVNRKEKKILVIHFTSSVHDHELVGSSLALSLSTIHSTAMSQLKEQAPLNLSTLHLFKNFCLHEKNCSRLGELNTLAAS